MSNRTDILLNGDFDAEIQESVIQRGLSDQQHVELLLLLEPGELREMPFVGFGIKRRLKQRVDAQKFLRQMEVELGNDGYGNANIIIGKNITDFKIEI